jgi:hypothetical protein
MRVVSRYRSGAATINTGQDTYSITAVTAHRIICNSSERNDVSYPGAEIGREAIPFVFAKRVAFDEHVAYGRLVGDPTITSENV